jgi:hypothetical protein
MELKSEEVAAYLRMGSAPLDGALAERVTALISEAPLEERGIFLRDGERYLVCGTIGCKFDQWQRRLAATSALDALISQAIGTAAIEKTIDNLEEQIKAELKSGERLKPRWSPGYAAAGLEFSREILHKLDASRRIGVSLTESMILVPLKSVTAVCEICAIP